MPKIIGIIGLGSVGTRHARNLIALGHTVVGFDPTVMAADGFSVMWPPERLDGFDGVVIASPTSEHLDGLSNAILQGRPVFVEKPISDRWITAVEDMLAMAPAPVMVGNNLRFHPCVKQAKKWLPSIGLIYYAHFNCAQRNDREDYARDGVLLNWGAHEVDLARYLLGDAQVGYCCADTKSAQIVLEHKVPVGRRSTIHLDYMAQPEWRGFTILGTGGRIAVDLPGRKAWLHKTDYPESFTGYGSYDDDYIDEMKAFIDCIDGKETLGATGDDGVAVLELLLRAKEIAVVST